MKIRVVDYIANYLETLGVRSVFLLSGGGMMHLLDAISRKESIRYICNHHEQSSAFAADGYARQTGKLGVCYATSGPGASNTVTGIVSSYQDSIPVLFITGQSKISQTIQGSKLFNLRQFGATEVDIVTIAKSITKYCVFLDDPKMIRYHLEKACALALSGRPGPVLIDIPLDLQGAMVDPDTMEGYTEQPFQETLLSKETVNRVIDRLMTAKRPLLLAGHGVRCAGERERFRRVIEKLNTPVTTTPFANDLLEYGHKLLVGHPGGKGDRPGNFAVQTTDCMLILGCSLHVMTTGFELDQFAPRAYKIQVEIDENVMKREKVGVQEKIQCSVQAFLEVFEACLDQRRDAWLTQGAWHERCQLWKRDLAVMNEPHARPHGKINYYDLCDALSRLTIGNESIMADAGSAFYVIGQAFRAKKNQRVLICGALGQMGYALPATTGVCMADPSINAICVTGDGSLQMNIHELATIRKNQLNAKIFVVNNGGYVSIRNTQNNFFKGHLAGTSESSGVWLPDLKKLANAYEIPFQRVDRLADLSIIVQEVLQSTGPVLCEVVTPEEQLIIPTVSSVRLPDGRMQSKPLHDMAPFMDEQILRRYMITD